MTDHLSTDAEPVAARRIVESPSSGSDRRVIEFPPDPPVEWSLNNLLGDIALSITKDELNKIKGLFKGPKGIGKGDLEKCDTCGDFFSRLRERGYISKGNLVYLIKILHTLKKRELIEKVVEYCRAERNVVFYKQTEYTKGSGEVAVKFHVVADIATCSQETVERLRNIVARIVCAPVEEVTITAVEPGSSMLITLTMPAMYAAILRKLLQSKANLWEFRLVQVDLVVVEEDPFSICSLTADDDVAESDQQKKLRNIYVELEETYHQLEIKDNKMLELEGKLAKQEKENQALKWELSEIRSRPKFNNDREMVTSEVLFDQPASINKQNKHYARPVGRSNSNVETSTYRPYQLILNVGYRSSKCLSMALSNQQT